MAKYNNLNTMFMEQFEELTNEELMKVNGGMRTLETIAHAISGPLSQISSNLETATSWF